MADLIEILRMQSQSRLDQLIARLDSREEHAIRESRAILAKIVIDGNPMLLADVMRGISARIDAQQEQIDKRNENLRGEN
jgi:hypothetical protein